MRITLAVVAALVAVVVALNPQASVAEAQGAGTLHIRRAAQAVERWSGSWNDPGNAQWGRLDFVLAEDGTIDGKVTNDSLSLVGQWIGLVRDDGYMFARYAYPTEGFAARSVALITAQQRNVVSGPMVWVDGNDQVFGVAQFSMSRTSLSRQVEARQETPFTGNGMYVYCSAPSVCGQRGGNTLPGNWGWTGGLFGDIKRSYPHVWCNLYPGSC